MVSKSNSTSEEIFNYMETNMGDKLGDEPTVISGNINQDAENMIGAINKLKEAYEKKTEGDVRPEFNKFDTDGSGSIDKGELRALSEALGSPMDDE